jgi:Tol biopolymer transport system component
MNPDGSRQLRITDHPAEDIEPSWAGDGLHLLFSSNRTGNHEIYRLELSENLEPLSVVQLTDNDAEDDHPVWVSR